MKSSHHLLLGAHMSVSGGFDQAIVRAESIGCTAMQIFTKSNRQWHAKVVDPNDAASFKAAVAQSSLELHNIIVHATYLINIGSPDKAIEKKSVQAVLTELDRCQMLGIPYLVLHPGSHTNSDEKTCLNRIADNLNYILEHTHTSVSILLENMSGQGSTVCDSFEQLHTVYRQSDHKKKLGFCFDTCHAFAAGYDFRTKKGYDNMWKAFEELLGIKKIKAMHINDSKRECGSHVDRHEDIGKGKIGTHAFELLFNDPRFFDVPKILETPNKELAAYKHNMDIIKKHLSASTRKKLLVP
ncbi:MAG TPA: deoxyribonuclease IV [Candidatus Bathyarchaeia archaeon]|nr:deoxyribonuclease IV [Candidatus Bathyarchaeia archaeon]